MPADSEVVDAAPVSGQERSLAIRIGAIGAGLAVMLLGLTGGAFRDTEGFLSGAVALPLGVAVGLIIVGVTATAAWARSGRWAALAIAGQGATLALVDAGNMVAYQHLRAPLDLTRGVGGIAVLLLAATIGAVLLAKKRFV